MLQACKLQLTFPLVGRARVSSSFRGNSLNLRPCMATPPVPLLLLLLPPEPLLLRDLAVLLPLALPELLLVLSVLMLTGSEGLLASRLAVNSHQGSHRPPACTCCWQEHQPHTADVTTLWANHTHARCTPYIVCVWLQAANLQHMSCSASVAWAMLER